ncbi:MAG: AAA family ATPase [Clostridium sp.]
MSRQKEGILRAFQYPVTIITGGPGRGKTTDISFIIEVRKFFIRTRRYCYVLQLVVPDRRMSDCTAYPALTIHKAIWLKGEAGEEEWDRKYAGGISYHCG